MFHSEAILFAYRSRRKYVCTWTQKNYSLASLKRISAQYANLISIVYSASFLDTISFNSSPPNTNNNTNNNDFQ